MRSGSRLRASQRALSAQCRGAVITALWSPRCPLATPGSPWSPDPHRGLRRASGVRSRVSLRKLCLLSWCLAQETAECVGRFVAEIQGISVLGGCQTHLQRGARRRHTLNFPSFTFLLLLPLEDHVQLDRLADQLDQTDTLVKFGRRGFLWGGRDAGV